MCREQLPVWQQIHESFVDKVQIVGVAFDAQGPEKPKIYTDKAAVTFPVLIDSNNLLGKIFGFRGLPNGLLVEPGGIIAYSKFGGFEIREIARRKDVEKWIISDDSPVIENVESNPLHDECLTLFQAGIVALEKENLPLAIELWRKAVNLDPKNLVVRKQLWALENPARFYTGDVDLEWQKGLLEKGL